MLHSHLLAENVPLHAEQRLLVLNSAADPLVAVAARRLSRGRIVLAEDNVSALAETCARAIGSRLQHIPFHEYTRVCVPGTIDIAAMNLQYQPSKAWVLYGVEAARYVLKPGGWLYVAGAKDRGILSIARRIQKAFGNSETVEISKGWRLIAAQKRAETPVPPEPPPWPVQQVFAGGGELDEGTRLLLEALEVHVTDVALDLGCGVGHIGLYIAERARKGSVTLVDASLAAVALAGQRLQENGLTNAQVLASDATQAVRDRRFSLIATNPPFYVWGTHTKAVGERFIRESAPLLARRGRFYLVANRFLKYEPVLQECFEDVQEVGGNSRYKVLRATSPVRRQQVDSHRRRARWQGEAKQGISLRP
jgi:16S rRNA (guanine1207-N2)-methyltransferase